jgi:2-polyprenyl-6-methoxyphenol hydroxylase-like FAD-dependent oxidoreductase
MNTAIADGFDLGWKLAWVLSGWDRPALLDPYEPERRPVAEHQVRRSIDPLGSRRSIDELHVDLGGRIRHIWLPGQPGRSTVDLLGTGLTLLYTGIRPPHRHAAPVTAHRLDALTARSLGIAPGQHLLLRPDGLPVQSGSATEAVRDEHLTRSRRAS